MLNFLVLIILSRIGVTYKTGFGVDDWIYWHLIHTTRDYRQYSAIAILHTLQFTFTQALGFSAFTSRILATDFEESHCHFKSHMRSSFHSLIPFLSLFCNCKFQRLDLIQFLCSQVYIPTGWLDSSLPSIALYSAASSVSFYNPSARTTQKTQLHLLKKRVYWAGV
jgi:hypothetical protein